MRTVKIPSFEQVVARNQAHLRTSEGLFTGHNNLANEASLYWVLHTMQHPVSFGQNRYPGIVHKGALLAWEIISTHIFNDGNKRTGMSSLVSFLELNGFRLIASDDEIESLALQVADRSTSGITYEALVTWIHPRIARIFTSRRANSLRRYVARGQHFLYIR